MLDLLQRLAHTNPIVAVLCFVIIRALAIVISPIPGAAIDIPAIAVFGWFPAFLYAEVGILIGASVAFGLARRYREAIVGRLTFLKRVQEWESRLSETEKTWAWIAIRLPTNPAFDYISYAAGLTEVGFRKFVVTTFVGSLPSVFLFFYVGGKAMKLGVMAGFIFAALFIIVGLVVFKRFSSTDKKRPGAS